MQLRVSHQLGIDLQRGGVLGTKQALKILLGLLERTDFVLLAVGINLDVGCDHRLCCNAGTIGCDTTAAAVTA